MTNPEFLSQLESELMGKLPPQELEEVLRYHEEYFAEVGEHAAGELDPPRIIAQRVLEEYRQRERAVHRKAAGWIVGAVAITVLALSVGLGVRSGVRSLVWGIFGHSGVFTTVETAIPEPVEEPVVDFSAETPIGGYLEEGTPFRGVQLDIAYGDVAIQSGEDYAIEFYRDEYQEWSCYVGVDDVLHITATRTKTLPVGTDSAAQVTLTVPEGQGLENVELGLDYGNVEARGIEADGLYVYCDMGGIDLKDVAAGGVSCRADKGDISLTNVKTDGELVCSTDMGKISGDSIYGSAITLTADMGAVDVTLAGKQWEYGLELCTEMGAITIAGEKQPDNDIGYWSEEAERLLSATTNLGAIVVDFTEK